MAKILVVDDERDVVELLRFLLTHDGNTVEGVYDGEQALKTMGLIKSDSAPFTPDLVVLDLMMPIIDGYTVHSKMSADAAARNIPIVILTAKGQINNVLGTAANIAAYIEKPFDPEILRKKLKDILKQRNLK